MEKGVSAGYQKSLESNWRQWAKFSAEIGIDPLLTDVSDPIPFLQVFAHQVRTGKCAIRGQPLKKRTVEHYIRAVGQTIALLGSNDPRHNSFGDTDFRLLRQLRSYKREDPPASRVKPIPIPILDHVYNTNILGNTCQQCVADMLWIAFYFLLRPGEYCNAGADNDSTPFRLCDVTF